MGRCDDRAWARTGPDVVGSLLHLCDCGHGIVVSVPAAGPVLVSKSNPWRDTATDDNKKLHAAVFWTRSANRDDLTVLPTKENSESLGLAPWAFTNLAGALLYAAPCILAQIFTGER